MKEKKNKKIKKSGWQITRFPIEYYLCLRQEVVGKRNARVAQWWSIALPRRGSRVRIPSRALKEIEKRVIRWMALFSMFKPCRVRTVRMSPRCCGRRSRTSPGRSATSRALNKMWKRGDIRWVSLFLYVRMSLLRSGRRRRTSRAFLVSAFLSQLRRLPPL